MIEKLGSMTLFSLMHSDIHEAIYLCPLRKLTPWLFCLWHFQKPFDFSKWDAAITGQNKVSYIQYVADFWRAWSRVHKQQQLTENSYWSKILIEIFRTSTKWTLIWHECFINCWFQGWVLSCIIGTARYSVYIYLKQQNRLFYLSGGIYYSTISLEEFCLIWGHRVWWHKVSLPKKII